MNGLTKRIMNVWKGLLAQKGQGLVEFALILAFCAGIAPMRPLKMTKRENMIEVMDANLFSFIEIVRCITKKGWFADEGSIVAVSSTASIQGKQTKVAYSASKAERTQKGPGHFPRPQTRRSALS